MHSGRFPVGLELPAPDIIKDDLSVLADEGCGFSGGERRAVNVRPDFGDQCRDLVPIECRKMTPAMFEAVQRTPSGPSSEAGLACSTLSAPRP
jgi:hypothetical protein